MDNDDKVMIASVGLIVLSILVGLGLESAFAEGDIEDTVKDVVTEGLDDAIDKFSENIDLVEGNPLNATQEETEELMDSGQNLIGITLELIFASHETAEDAVLWVSPVDIHPFILAGIALAIAVIIGISILKRLAMHMVIFVVVALSVVGVIVFLLS